MNYKERRAKIEEFKILADKGDARAASMVAGLSMRDLDGTSFKYANTANELSGGTDHEALNILGCCYEYGVGCEKDLKRSFDFYLKASELGNDESQYKLGSTYLIGDVVPKDIDKAIEWLSRSAATGNKMGEEYLAYTKMVKDGLVSEFTIVRSEESMLGQPFVTVEFLSGEKTEVKDEKEYFDMLDDSVETAKNDPSVENVCRAKEVAIFGMQAYYERGDLYNNELIYNTVKPLLADDDCKDFASLMMDWAIENCYGLLRCSAKEKEGLDNILKCVSLMERAYNISFDEGVKKELIGQCLQAADMFSRFEDNENAKMYAWLADKIRGEHND